MFSLIRRRKLTADNPRLSEHSGNVCLNLADSHDRERTQAETDLVRAHQMFLESVSCVGSHGGNQKSTGAKFPTTSNPISAASAATANGSLQTALSKVPGARRWVASARFSPSGTSDRVLPFLANAELPTIQTTRGRAESKW